MRLITPPLPGRPATFEDDQNTQTLPLDPVLELDQLLLHLGEARLVELLPQPTVVVVVLVTGRARPLGQIRRLQVVLHVLHAIIAYQAARRLGAPVFADHTLDPADGNARGEIAGHPGCSFGEVGVGEMGRGSKMTTAVSVERPAAAEVEVLVDLAPP